MQVRKLCSPTLATFLFYKLVEVTSNDQLFYLSFFMRGTQCYTCYQSERDKTY